MAARSGGRRATKSASTKSTSRTETGPGEARWTFLSNHSHVLLCLHREPDLTLREVADRVGITERSVQRILGELEEAGYVTRERVGLRNRYRFRTSAPLRHPIEAHCRIGDLIDMVESAGR
jgi:predicted ArsR family transcriptional regulator